jgi:rod shape-determining protein MreD
MLVRMVGDSQGRVFRGKSFLLLWWGFGLVALGASMVIWTLSAALALAPLDPRPALFQAAMTTALFPFLGGMFAWTQQRLLPQV